MECLQRQSKSVHVYVSTGYIHVYIRSNQSFSTKIRTRVLLFCKKNKSLIRRIAHFVICDQKFIDDIEYPNHRMSFYVFIRYAYVKATLPAASFSYVTICKVQTQSYARMYARVLRRETFHHIAYSTYNNFDERLVTRIGN